MEFNIEIGDGVSAAVDYIRNNFQDGLDGIATVIEWVADGTFIALDIMPWWLLTALLVVLSLWRVGWKFSLFTLGAMLLVVGMGLWEETVNTLALVLTATFIALVVGIPIGIAMSRNDTLETLVRPILDLMQTLPPFVYLIPAAMFFGLGKVPGTIATIVFAMPPVVRLTNLGIRQVSEENVEAGLAFGCTDWQLLSKVQFPLALPTIMAGVNQTIMLALSMVVIASMIGAGGLGNTVLTGIQRLDVGLGFEGGLGVVVLAILLDRITQSFGHGATGGLFSFLKSVFATGSRAEGHSGTRDEAKEASPAHGRNG
ncbi:proline/glycine betaine ABC transporter permease [Marivibrio halodurans]|uniref:Proline/glycine betaine ABC transporter permease n=1 Tax=Marivibrio halodurans TaxID=2039722 RepID=A0A8J7SG74_9PROT|nr:proline/glycine betaine ABC transporter permease [Marivibrio halodurans]MBP5855548.1 proline/glycine betaine ABC transporter permease [Marivibrio halodurans]